MDSSVSEILNGFRVLVHALHVSSRNAEERVGLTGAQLFVLQKLEETNSLTVNELAQRTHTHQSTVSVVVTKLVEKGLVSRVRSAEDARVQVLSLTKQGREKLRKAPESIQDRLIASIAKLSRNDRNALSALLAKVLNGADLAKVMPELFLENKSEK
ncbi:MAG TPA: MarR family transcriptional regulator [Candidatus Kapabacteria bacterium]|nr:MarR family transcriptional regulator [Candidatus Kapabacteria bacterium]